MKINNMLELHELLLSNDFMVMNRIIFLAKFTDEYGWDNSKGIGRKLIMAKDGMSVQIMDGVQEDIDCANKKQFGEF